eukprot:SAG31_NODE_81_length_27131_cov_4.775283_18_plen_50_part_00
MLRFIKAPAGPQTNILVDLFIFFRQRGRIFDGSMETKGLRVASGLQLQP